MTYFTQTMTVGDEVATKFFRLVGVFGVDRMSFSILPQVVQSPLQRQIVAPGSRELFCHDPFKTSPFRHALTPLGRDWIVGNDCVVSKEWERVVEWKLAQGGKKATSPAELEPATS